MKVPNVICHHKLVYAHKKWVYLKILPRIFVYLIQTLGDKTGCHFSSHCRILDIIANCTLRQPPTPQFSMLFAYYYLKMLQKIMFMQTYAMHNFLLAYVLPTLNMGGGGSVLHMNIKSGKSFVVQCLNFEINAHFINHYFHVIYAH